MLATSGYHSINKSPRIAYVPLQKPRGTYSKTLAISVRFHGKKSRTMGYITVDAQSNHKTLWLRGPDGNPVLGPSVPQTRRTNMDMLAHILHVHKSRITLRDKTGHTGPTNPVGAPVFRSSSVAGWVEL